MIRSAFAAAILVAAAQAGAAEHVARLQPIDDRKAVFATVEAVDVAAARARIGGTVAVLSVDEGDAVQAGQRIAVVADPKLQLELAALDQRISSLQAQRDLSATELKRARDLFGSGTLAKARVDDAETAFAVAERALAAMTAERRVVAERHAEGVVLAPAAGRVLAVDVTEGMVVMPGEPVAQIAREQYVLRLELPERHARFIREGDAVSVGDRGLSLEADPTPRAGRVVKVYPRIRDGRVIADVVVDGLGDFFVGERVRVDVSTGTRSGMLVPAEYLYRRFGVDYVRLKDGAEVVVQAGGRLGGDVEILSGLRDGDVVVTP